VAVGLGASAGAPGNLEISPASVAFGDVVVGTTQTRTFTLTNTGGTDVVINKSKPPFGSAFTAATSLPEGTTIAPGQTIAESVSFTPARAGVVAPGAWAITGNDVSGPHNVQFTGSGWSPGPGSTTTSTTANGTSPPPARSPSHPVAVPKAPRLAPARVTPRTVGHTYITYTALVAHVTTFTVRRQVTGRRAGAACRALTARNRHARPCMRLVTVAVFSHRDRVGTMRLHLTSLVAARELTPGTYGVQSVLYDASGVRHVFTAVLRVAPSRR
jgi:hypothetical protein